jgi:hypothetical protein
MLHLLTLLNLTAALPYRYRISIMASIVDLYYETHCKIAPTHHGNVLQTSQPYTPSWIMATITPELRAHIVAQLKLFPNPTVLPLSMGLLLPTLSPPFSVVKTGPLYVGMPSSGRVAMMCGYESSVYTISRRLVILAILRRKIERESRRMWRLLVVKPVFMLAVKKGEETNVFSAIWSIPRIITLLPSIKGSDGEVTAARCAQLTI